MQSNIAYRFINITAIPAFKNVYSGLEMNSKEFSLPMPDLHFNIFKILRTSLQKLENCLEMSPLQLSKGKVTFKCTFLYYFSVFLISSLIRSHLTLVIVSSGLENNLKKDMLIKSSNCSITFLPIKKLHQVKNQFKIVLLTSFFRCSILVGTKKMSKIARI